MTFEADFRAHLGVSAELGTLVGDGIYPVVRPQGSSAPAVTYLIFAPDPMNNLDGRDESLRQYRVQVDSWSRSFEEAAAVASAVFDQLNTTTSTLKATLIEGGGFDDYEPDTRIYRRSRDYRVWHRET